MSEPQEALEEGLATAATRGVAAPAVEMAALGGLAVAMAEVATVAAAMVEVATAVAQEAESTEMAVAQMEVAEREERTVGFLAHTSQAAG